MIYPDYCGVALKIPATPATCWSDNALTRYMTRYKPATHPLHACHRRLRVGLYRRLVSIVSLNHRRPEFVGPHNCRTAAPGSPSAPCRAAASSEGGLVAP